MSAAPRLPDLGTPALRRRRWRRRLGDRLTRYGVTLGGFAVLGTLLLIFYYLGQVVLPLFRGASLAALPATQPAWMDGAAPALLLDVDERARVALRLDADGVARFFRLDDGMPLGEARLPLPAGTRIASLGQGQPGSGLLALGLSDGGALLARVSYGNDRPALDYPFGPAPLALDPDHRALAAVALAGGERQLLLAGVAGDALQVLRIERDGETPGQRLTLPAVGVAVRSLLLDPRQDWLYALDVQSRADVFDLRDGSLNGRYALTDGSAQVTAVAPLLGGVSLLVGDDRGGIGQWFMARDADGRARLAPVRRFQLGQAPVLRIVAEVQRKGFVALDAGGTLGVFHATAQRRLLIAPLFADGADLRQLPLALSPRADLLLAEQGGALQRWRLDNPHPEISWRVLWDKVWYEHHDAPEYLWQSTAASTDAEPKLSLAPLAFGTLKAAAYAMLLAAPLALGAAVYTACFMAPAQRRRIKPAIELMEALPTVILGFLAGLFLAPYVEAHLPGLFALLLLAPLAVVLAAWGWSRLPEPARARLPAGSEALWLLPVLLLACAAALGASPYLERALFGGDLRLWLADTLGVNYDQRNALVVGMAMGFAVVPNIYSIAEDALSSVPRSLVFGSLALGATPWQTLRRVVLPTASPGLFSALMIGLGRAVGETMIVLMATGNTPIMDASLLDGMRTLAANVAVEMPEAAVGGSHYRVLFLSALLLLVFTFAMNTLAELIRARLRRRYANL